METSLQKVVNFNAPYLNESEVGEFRTEGSASLLIAHQRTYKF